jgi:hypothetical protein
LHRFASLFKLLKQALLIKLSIYEPRVTLDLIDGEAHVRILVRHALKQVSRLVIQIELGKDFPESFFVWRT